MASSAINIDGHGAADLNDRRKAAKRVGQRRPTYFAQAVSYSVDAAILALYYVASVTSATTSLVYLAAGLGWAAFTLFLSETRFNDHFEDHYLTVPQSPWKHQHSAGCDLSGARGRILLRLRPFHCPGIRCITDVASANGTCLDIWGCRINLPFRCKRQAHSNADG
jgi:hypothetical protein